MRVTLSYPDAKKATSQITRYRIAQCWCNDGPPSATLGQHYPSQNPLSSNHKYNREYYYFLTLLKTQLSDLATSNVIFDMLIRTGVQKCQPFPTHSTPLSPKKDTNSGKINLLVSWDKKKCTYQWNFWNIYIFLNDPTFAMKSAKCCPVKCMSSSVNCPSKYTLVGFVRDVCRKHIIRCIIPKRMRGTTSECVVNSMWWCYLE